MKQLLPLALLLLANMFPYLPAQAQRSCGTDEYLARILQDPARAQEYEAHQRFIQSYIQQHGDALRDDDTVYTIPVVFHVVYKNATENIADSQLISQIEVLNEDFRRLNADTVNTPLPFKSVAADVRIEFCLASFDPDGNPTTGITRTQTTEPNFNTNDRVKFDSTGGKNAWPRDQYLNYWVCDLGGGLLGYASGIGGGGNPATDGVVIGYNYTGRVGTLAADFDLGRTATHEVGHWLGLSHTWGAGGCTADDGVADTPPQDAPNYGCQTYPFISCNNGPTGDMFMNYMDYSDDICFNLFTLGQTAIMRATFAPGGNHHALLSSQGCVNPAYNDIGISQILAPDTTECGGSFDIVFTLFNYGENVVDTADIVVEVDGVALGTVNWSGTLLPGHGQNVTFTPASPIAPGPHNLFIYTDGVSGQLDPDNLNNGQIAIFEVLDNLGQPIPYLEGFETGIFPPTGWTITNPDGGATWEQTSLASKTGNASIRMENYTYDAIGEADEFVLPDLDLTPFNRAGLSFWVAYAKYGSNTGFSDTLEVWVSGDCGKTYELAYKQFDGGLVTAPATASPFVPNQWQWRLEWVDLSDYTSNTGVSIKFRHITNYENNLYLDNINIGEIFALGVDNPGAETFAQVWPNPARHQLQLLLAHERPAPATVTLYDLSGRQLRQVSISAAASGEVQTLPVGDLARGLYLLEIQQDGRRQLERVQLD
ncbi:MAG: T9SS C-terminal target domain-containing protein [Bacteroidetes bacterium]|nr:MAG: T9SS C-terminal target domain-containing protein [Bacteroidota bacterium]